MTSKIAEDGKAEQSEARTARQQAELRERERAEKKAARDRRKEGRPKLKKLRFALVGLGLGLLALVSWIFGVMMAVAGDLPDLETRAQFERAENSVVVDEGGERIATLTGNQRRVLIESEDISPLIKQAVVAIEDERFYEHRGIDYLGLARALREDILSRSAAQGGSTITQQFVKNALSAQEQRTILQKLKESALAYQLERQWSKDKILTNYLNNIYFGEGAYGIESAARVYFGANHPGCGEDGEPSCASQVRVEEAALLAGMISSPTAYSPKANPEDAEERRNIVLDKMREVGVLDVSDEELETLKQTSLPGDSQIEPPSAESKAPYFTDWLRQQIVDRYGAGAAFGGGLEITSTLDLELQEQAQEIVDSRLSGLGPTAAVVVIDNATGGVRAMVGGSDFQKSPFNLATNGLRQPGSSFKPFTLVTALSNGKSPTDVYASEPKQLPFVNEVKTKSGDTKEVNELFEVANYEDSYLGTASIGSATTFSDNSVYAELGMEVGTDKIADMARDLGIQSRVPDNPAMILGGLKRGVTPLEMAYAYSTLANRGLKVSGTMASRGNGEGPVAIEEVSADDKPVKDDLGASGENEKTEDRVVDEAVADQTVELLRTVVTQGTGVRAQVGDDFIWGKTGTTDNNADAWFVGSNDAITVAVWVGYEDGATPMLTEFAGAPVDGGTIPTLIFAEIINAYNNLSSTQEAAEKAAKEEGETTETTAPAEIAPPPVETAPAPEPAPPPVEEAPPAPATDPQPQGGGGGGESGGGGGGAPVDDGGGAATPTG